MMEPNTDALTLIFVALIVFVPITLHTIAERRSTREDQTTEVPDCEGDQER